MDNRLTLAGFLPDQMLNKNVAPPGTTFVGIDFGTSTTVAAYASFSTDSQVQVDTLATNQRTHAGGMHTSDKTPTVIAFSTKLNEIYIGQGAADLKFHPSLQRGKNVWYSFKMELGEDRGPYPNSVLRDLPGFENITTAREAATVFFKFIKAEIIAQLKDKGLPTRIAWAVSIPASFEANQRRDLLAALQAADISVTDSQCLIDEPNAAILSVLQNQQQDADTAPIYVPEHRPLNILVFDFGAGTCDISVLEIGLDREAFYSKNLSISRFEAIGGDNLDIAVALKVLLPQLEAVGLPVEDFSRRQLNEDILPQLLKAAETLKIELCRTVAFSQQSERTSYAPTAIANISSSLPALAHSDTVKQLAEPLTVYFQGQTYTVPKVTITYSQFATAIAPFLDPDCDAEELHGQMFLSIFEPIKSALEKAALESEDLDYVLLIGGSAKNPYVESALREAFPGKGRLLIPRDLQAHVGKGAAIHSLMFHGLGRNLIQPITGEPISVITRGGHLETLVPSGTQIPCPTQRITGLRPQREGQQTLEVPICLGHVDRILHVIHLTAPTSKGFSINDEVEVECLITLDKVVHVQARTGGLSVQAVPLNPYANKHLSTAERAVYLAAKEVRIAAARNSGRPTGASLKRLSDAYSKAANARQAAETLKEAYDLDKTSTSLNNIAVAFSAAGDKVRALKFYELAYQQDPDAVTVMNLADSLPATDPRTVKLMEEAFSKGADNPYVLYKYALFQEKTDPSQYKKLLAQALEIYEKQFRAETLRENDYFRLRSTAQRLSRADLVAEVTAAEQRNKQTSGFFNEANTLEKVNQTFLP
jgi:molecular chaperone DnaK